MVTVLPSGLVGWFRYQGIEQIQALLGIRKQVATYPSLEEDAEVQIEREILEAEE